MPNFMGQLQEYCQKKGANLPKYKVNNVGGPSHMPTFIASVEFLNDYICEGKEARNIKSARQYAALEGLILIGLIKPETYEVDKKIVDRRVRESDKNPDICLLIDMENMPNFFEDMDELMNEKPGMENKIKLYGFTSNNHSLSIKYANDERVYVIRSAAPNACDIGLIMFVAGILIKNPPKKILIATSDENFGLGLIDCVTSGFIDELFGVEGKEEYAGATLIRNIIEVQRVVEEN